MRHATRQPVREILVLAAVGMLWAGGMSRVSAGEALRKTRAGRLFDQAADLQAHRRERERAAELLLADPRAALPLLLGRLQSERSIHRQTAAILLGELGDPRAEAPLVETALSEDFLAGGHARQALVKLYASFAPDALGERVASRLPEKIAEAARAGEARSLIAASACEAVHRMYGREEAPALPATLEALLRDGLAHQSPDVRQAAARVLGLSGEKSAASALLARLDEETAPAVLATVCRAVARIRPVTGGEKLLPLAEHADKRVQLETIAALYGLGYGRTLPRIAAFLEEASQPLRVRAVEILGDLRDPAALKALGKATRDVSWVVRLEAVRAFGKMERPGVTGVLRLLLQDEHPRVRAEAAVLLDRMQVPGAVWALIDDLESGETAYRIAAARAAGRVRASRAIRALGSAVHAEDLELACSAAEALGKIGERRGTEELLAAGRDPRPALRQAARQALQAIFGSDPGPDAEAWPAWAEAQASE